MSEWMELLAKAVAVAGLQVVLFVLVPAWALARLRWRDGSEWLFASGVAGVVSVALLGRLFNGFEWGAGRALGVWLAAWGAIGFCAWRRNRDARVPRLDGTLLAILALAWGVRMVHPLQTWALGQSDAYVHLWFMRDVLERGAVANSLYPPAYSWVMALPGWLLPGHPYWVARFGGAFFGMGLALGVHALMAQVKGRAAGLAAAALVAGCPAFWLLQKTGVGCFPNQMGLLLIPAVLWAYASGNFFWLALALAGLLVSVPMMLLHVLLLLGILWLAILWLFEGFVWRNARWGVAALVLGAVGMIAVSLRLSPGHGMVLASHFTNAPVQGLDPSSLSWPRVWGSLLADFLSVKRWGYGAWPANLAALGSTLVLAWAWIGGWRRRDVAWFTVGGWGLLSSFNLHLGLFQFTNYQREGWSLLIALACLGGLLFDVLWHWKPAAGPRRIWAVGLALAAGAGLWIPPTHAIPAGPSESDVVEFLLSLDPETMLLARSMQGDVVRAFHEETVPEVWRLDQARGPILFLRDHPQIAPEVSPFMKVLQPSLTRLNEWTYRQAETVNRATERQLQADYEIRSRKNVSPHLEIWEVGPKRPE
ncbi:MAG: hypothetical protein AB7V14_03500 [Kiritimatiellia bacterium]